VSEQNSVSKIY